MTRHIARWRRRAGRALPGRKTVFLICGVLCVLLCGLRLHRVGGQLMESAARRWGGALLAACADAGMEAAGGALVRLDKDPAGEIQLVAVDEGKFHALRTAAMEKADELLSAGRYTARIPLGSLFFGEYFPDAGPEIPLTYLPEGAVTITCESETRSAGINQTAYRVVLRMNLRVTAATAFGRQTVTVPYETAAAELLVVGDVPAVYAFGGEVREIQGNDK